MSRIFILGAGFGGLATLPSEALGENAGVTVIDEGEEFIFGYSKLDVMFGRATPEEVRLPYAEFAKAGVRLVRETITAIDRNARQVTTDKSAYQADVLAVALGAGYDLEATPRLANGPHEFYSVSGAERMRDILPSFVRGRALVGRLRRALPLAPPLGLPDRVPARAAERIRRSQELARARVG